MYLSWNVGDLLRRFTMYDIDCGLLMRAMSYYESVGYKPVTAPMLVDEDIVNITLPKSKQARKHLDKYYVGSAEQSFYQLMKDGLEPDGEYMMITPCERDEVEDENHLGIFLKVELISTRKTRYEILSLVSDFLSSEGIKGVGVETDEGFDLEVNGIEVGSYGNRIYKGINIKFGTGLALPRISQAINNPCNQHSNEVS